MSRILLPQSLDKVQMVIAENDVEVGVILSLTEICSESETWPSVITLNEVRMK